MKRKQQETGRGRPVHPLAQELPSEDLTTDRRTFLTLMGASTALAGTGLAGCLRKPAEKILPFARRPEDLIPGNPARFATALYTGGGVLGLLVESQEGRPTKVEGNPDHPMSNPNHLQPTGGTHHWAQASVLDLYDPDRSRSVRHRNRKSSWKAFWAFAERHFATLRRQGGKGLAILSDGTPSPTRNQLLFDLVGKRPHRVKTYVLDPGYPLNQQQAMLALGAPGHRPLYQLDRTDVVLAVDSDLLGLEGDGVRNARLFAARRVQGETPGQRGQTRMSRLYVVEPHFTATGIAADNRLRASPILAGRFLAALHEQLAKDGVLGNVPTSLPPTLEAWPRQMAKATGKSAAFYQRWIQEVARELVRHKGRGLISVGPRQPSGVHHLAYNLNHALGNVTEGGPMVLIPERAPLAGPQGLHTLASEIRRGAVQTLVMLGTNPAYASPGSLQLAKLLPKVPVSIHLSDRVDETSRLSTWHLPASHYLETWGDLAATDGTVSIQQPLIAPLYDSLSEIELLERMLGRRTSGHDLVRAHWKKRTQGGGFERRWERWLHQGTADLAQPAPRTPAPSWKTVATPRPDSPTGLVAVFQLDPSLYDGRFANNGWLQELPDTVTKLAWDNAALMAPSTARRLGVNKGDLIRLSLQGHRAEMAVWIAPGVAEHTVVLPLGYGRTAAGRIAKQGRGFNAYGLQPSVQPYSAEGLTIKKTGRKHSFAVAQKHGSMKEPFTGRRRPVVRVHTLKEYRHPSFKRTWAAYSLIKKSHNRSLWIEPNVRTGHQWGMAIDLSRCMGCNTCTVACQAENAIPLVGKKEMQNGRELHWIRLDRYFESPQVDPEQDPDAELVVQPLPCQQCETAPCENVCPVGATLHSPDGLNDMAYNRCIGTRYCANNCPFKVRRYNFHAYAKRTEKLLPLLKMQRNPDVSVRFRGVMEKCTYCVQRIQEAKIAAKVDRQRRGVVQDGDVFPACAQACPTGAIVFGNINDPKSRVSALRRSPRNYGLLEALNLHPRTTYLAKLRNPNPRLA